MTLRNNFIKEQIGKTISLFLNIIYNNNHNMTII